MVFLLIFLFVGSHVSYGVLSQEVKAQLLRDSEESSSFSSENIIKALINCYPDIVKIASKKENKHYPELAITIRGELFYEINGRFLPEKEYKHWEKYSLPTFYKYPKEIPDPKKRVPETIKRLQIKGSAEYRKNKKYPYPRFNDTLYGIHKKSDTHYYIKETLFLKKKVYIHVFALKALKAVESELYDAAKTDKEIKIFLEELDNIWSFVFREIRGSKARSKHSYGIALDLLDEDSKKSTFWLWRQNNNINWITEEIDARWNPPMSVVKIFEKYGFTWGGKWEFYDTMHFEYKPEILLLNGYNVKFLR